MKTKSKKQSKSPGGKSGKSGKAKKKKSQSTAASLTSLTKVDDSVIDTEKVAREFAEWSATESNRVRVEIRRSQLATQLKDAGVVRGLAILRGAEQALKEEQQNAASRQLLAEMEAAAAAERAKWAAPKVVAQRERILTAPDILAEMLKTTDKLGHVGEEAVRSLIFLSAVAGLTARTHDDAIHLIVKGPSSGGKNAAIKRVHELLPRHAALVLSNTTALGLVYLGRSFPVLVFQEADGMRAAEYMVRQVMSEGTVSRLTAKGWFTTAFISSVITTTTRTKIHPENETRAFSISVSPDTELTRRIIMAEAATAAGTPRPSLDGDLLLGWRSALASLTGGDVVIPFADDLGRAFPPDRVRGRRDFLRVLNLIRACALLHQATRKRDTQKRLVAERCDHEMVEPVVRAISEVEAPRTLQGEQVLSQLKELASRSTDGWVERGELVQACAQAGVAVDKTVRTWCTQFTDDDVCEARTQGGRVLLRVNGR